MNSQDASTRRPLPRGVLQVYAPGACFVAALSGVVCWSALLLGAVGHWLGALPVVVLGALLTSALALAVGLYSYRRARTCREVRLFRHGEEIRGVVMRVEPSADGEPVGLRYSYHHEGVTYIQRASCWQQGADKLYRDERITVFVDRERPGESMPWWDGIIRAPQAQEVAA